MFITFITYESLNSLSISIKGSFSDQIWGQHYTMGISKYLEVASKYIFSIKVSVWFPLPLLLTSFLGSMAVLVDTHIYIKVQSWHPHMKENTWCLSIWVWAISLSMIIYNSICLPLKLIILFFLRVKWYIIVSIDKIFTVHLSVDGNLDYLYFLVVIMTIEEQVPLW